MENHAKYGDTIFFHDDHSLYLNLFIASELNWKPKGLVVRQETQFPDTDASKLTFHCQAPVSLTLKVRWPAWAEKGITVDVNGAGVKMDGKPGSYVDIEREWREGDQVTIRLPMTLRTEALPGNNPRIEAVFRGPIVLAGELGTEGLDKVNFWPNGQTDEVHVPTPLIPQLVCEPSDLVHSLVPVAGKPLTYQTRGVGRPKDVTLIPLYKVHFQRYSVYWKLLAEADWNDHQARIAAEEARRKTIEARIVDEVRPGEQQAETDHQFKGERTNSGDFNDHKWRDAHNGWFSYELKVIAGQAMTLRCTYWAPDVGREFDILVNGEKIATQTLPLIGKDGFSDEDYPIPTQLIQGKDKVTVKFQAHPGSTAGGVFGVLMLKP